MTFPDTGDLQSKSSSKANFLSLWSRSGGRRRRGNLLLKFRKSDFLWLKGPAFQSISDAPKSRNRGFQGRFEHREGSKMAYFSSNVSFFCIFSSEARPMCYWREHTKIQWLCKADSSPGDSKTAFFFLRKSRNFAEFRPFYGH